MCSFLTLKRAFTKWLCALASGAVFCFTRNFSSISAMDSCCIGLRFSRFSFGSEMKSGLGVEVAATCNWRKTVTIWRRCMADSMIGCGKLKSGAFIMIRILPSFARYTFCFFLTGCFPSPCVSADGGIMKRTMSFGSVC